MDAHLARHMDLWASGIGNEIDFWDDWMTRCPHELAERLNTNNPIDPLIARTLRWGPYQPGQPYRVLDVGSGPLHCIGFRIAGTVQPEIVACDPLAEPYSAICRRHKIRPPVPVTFAMVEELSAVFAPNTFDVVNCGNALDHTFNPVQGISEMMKVAKVGGSVLLRHTRNEAEREKYHGLHQWNFDSTEEGFVIWSPDASFIVNKLLDEPIETSLHGDEPSQVLVNIKKTKAMTEPRAGRELSELAEKTVRDWLQQHRPQGGLLAGVSEIARTVRAALTLRTSRADF